MSHDGEPTPGATNESTEPLSFSQIHPVAINSKEEIESILSRIWSEHRDLYRGMNRRILPEVARIDEFDSEEILLRTTDFDSALRHRILLNFQLDQRPYFFSSLLLRKEEGGKIRVETPAVIYKAERRDRLRKRPVNGESSIVAIQFGRQRIENVPIVDASPQGLGIAVPAETADHLEENFRVQFLNGSRKNEELFAETRRFVPIEDKVGWVQVGLEVSSAPRGEGLAIQTESSIAPRSTFQKASRRWSVVSAGLQLVADRALERLKLRERSSPRVQIVDYFNNRGEKIRSIIDSTGDSHGAPVVIIPPAWGKTKETLMPLAACIVSTFKSAGKAVSVVRFDGIRKRGESHNDSACLKPGCDHHRFTFSQGVRDIQATLDFLDNNPAYRPKKRILVSFSASSIEARKATAIDSRIDGWVSVVGGADLQSMMRVISGGIDYAAGFEKGARFGHQEILGIEVDMDHAGLDAFRNSMTYLEDARRDMARIAVPITWIHGQYDAWMDPHRIKDILSRGNPTNRRFVEVPTGHILSSSQEALDVFDLIVREISRMSLGATLQTSLPNLAEVERRRRVERARLPRATIDMRSFWRDYLVGRRNELGIELMMSIQPYEKFMKAQLEEMQIAEGMVIADLGAGTGSFPRFLAEQSSCPKNLKIVEIDFVRAGLERSRKLINRAISNHQFRLSFVESNLDVDQHEHFVPLRSESVDLVIASLLLSYVSEPMKLLREIRRILKPGGRFVASSLRRDADMSKLYMEGINELRQGRAREVFGKGTESRIDESAREYLNQASKLLDLEEKGEFQFWEQDKIEELICHSGFSKLKSRLSLGEPPQAVIVSGERW